MQMFAKLATDYGVPLQGLGGGQVDPQFSHVTQTVGTLQQQVQTMLAQQKQSEQAALQQQIDSFKAASPHFEAVKETMAGLLQAGVAPDLATAYQKAIRLHDDIWQQQQAEQAKADAAQRQALIAHKKAAAVSPRSSSPTGAMAAGGNAKKSLRDVLSEAVDSASSGRF
jgi:non-ribosomal peptide synthetase component F